MEISEWNKQRAKRRPEDHTSNALRFIELWFVIIKFIIARVALDTNNFYKEEVGILPQNALPLGIKAFVCKRQKIK